MSARSAFKINALVREALDEGLGRRVREQKAADQWPSGHFSSEEEGPLLLFFPPCSASPFFERRSAAFPPLLLLSFHSVSMPGIGF